MIWNLAAAFGIVGTSRRLHHPKCTAVEQNCQGMYPARMIEIRNKRPLLSRDGYLGMGPLTARPGDVVVVFPGARVPYVLRPKGDRKFLLLGEAYCDGVMDAEILTRRTKESFFLV
jgi:hypothetical protein